MPLVVGQLNNDPVLDTISENKGESPTQVALAWVKERGVKINVEIGRRDRIRTGRQSCCDPRVAILVLTRLNKPD
jgi:diketogulonate reductase-like aldo/keto reductase